MRLLLLPLLITSFLPVTADEFDVALLRPTRYLAEHPGGANDAHTYLQNARDILDVAGLRHHTVDEAEILAGSLSTAEFLICPYNPYMTAEVAKAIHAFLDAGGHALFCYFCEDSLRERLGLGELLYTSGGDEGLFRNLASTGLAPRGMPATLRQGSWNAYLLASLDDSISRPVLEWIAEDGQTNSGPAMTVSSEAAWFGHVMVGGNLPEKARMLLSVIGNWNPQVWDRAVQHALRPDLGFRFAEDIAALQSMSEGRPDASAAAGRLATQHEQIRREAGKVEPWETIQAAQDWRQGLRDVYMTCLPSASDDMRGAWVVMPGGCGDWGWERTAQVAAENGLTDLFVRVEWGGRASYPSEVIPSRLEPGAPDPVAQGIAACHRHGLRYHAWFISLNWRTPPPDLVQAISAQGLWQYSPDGLETVREGGDRSHWLNPSEPGVVDLQARMMSEVVAKYPVDGVHYDYIRYENYNGSYGERDRARFEAWASVKVGNWPADVLPASGGKPAGPLHEKFLEWRCEQVSNVVFASSAAVRAANPTCSISAAVYPSWPSHRLTVGQDWARWLREGWLDFVCPMVYDAPSYYDRHVDRVARLREAAGDRPLMAGLGSWLHTDPLTVAEQVVADRELGVDGFRLFSYTPELGESFLPALKRGVFAVPAKPR